MAISIAHVSDFHIAEDPGFRLKGENTRQNLALVVDHLVASDGVDLLFFGGDVAHDGSVSAYEFVSDLFGAIDCPVVVTPGNHDDVGRLDRFFGRRASGASELLRGELTELLVLDSHVPGEEGGHIDNVETMILPDGWLLLGLVHHDLVQPDSGGRPGMNAPVDALVQVLALPRPAVVLTGHRHLVADLSIGDLRILGAPATSTQFAFDAGVPSRAADSVPSYRLLELDQGALVTTEIVRVLP